MKKIVTVILAIIVLLIIGNIIVDCIWLTWDEQAEIDGDWVCETEDFVLYVNFSKYKYPEDSGYPQVNGTIEFKNGETYEAIVSLGYNSISYYDEQPRDDFASPDEYLQWDEEHYINVVTDPSLRLRRVGWTGFAMSDPIEKNKYVFKPA